MRLRRNATSHLLAAVGIAVAGCTHGDARSELDVERRAADVAALETVWTAEAVQAFLTLAPALNAVVGAGPGSPAVADVLLPATGGAAAPADLRTAAGRYTRTLREFLAGRTDPGGSAVLLPSNRLGTTWVWSERNDGYRAGREAAPDDRIRFVLYAVDSGGVATPLTPIGHVDLVERSSGATDAVQVVVVAGGTTWLDYRFSATTSVSGGRVDVLGYVTDGAERLNFDLRNTVAPGVDGFSLSSDNQLELVARSVDVAYSVVMTADPAAPAHAALTVVVNGERYGRVTWDEGSASALEGAAGAADATPSAADARALEQATGIWSYGLATIDVLARPIGGFFAL